jgi:hypothetical protein
VKLLSAMSFDPVVKDRLLRELNRGGPFLEPDDRGSIEGFIRRRKVITDRLKRTKSRERATEYAHHKLDMTPDKVRNTGRLEALAVFLDRLRDNPFVLLRQVAAVVGELSVPPDVLSVNPRDDKVIFRGTAYTVDSDACRFVKLLLEANGELVSTGDLKKELSAPDNKQIVPSRLIAELPEELQKAIESVPRKGTRLDIDRLMSQL